MFECLSVSPSVFVSLSGVGNMSGHHYEWDWQVVAWCVVLTLGTGLNIRSWLKYVFLLYVGFTYH